MHFQMPRSGHTLGHRNFRIGFGSSPANDMFQYEAIRAGLGFLKQACAEEPCTLSGIGPVKAARLSCSRIGERLNQDGESQGNPLPSGVGWMFMSI